jgi:hypothetical protein
VPEQRPMMKEITRITIAAFILFGCQSPSISSKKFFEYDEIEYYSSNADQEKLMSLTQNQSKSEIDSFTVGVILDDIPKDITDLYFIDKLEPIGFRKSLVDRSDFSSIDNLFREKTVKKPTWLSCIHLYRDILIFKKQNKVAGTAKICFSCLAHQIKGTSANTENFGQEGDYEILENILKK